MSVVYKKIKNAFKKIIKRLKDMEVFICLVVALSLKSQVVLHRPLYLPIQMIIENYEK